MENNDKNSSGPLNKFLTLLEAKFEARLQYGSFDYPEIKVVDKELEKFPEGRLRGSFAIRHENLSANLGNFDNNVEKLIAHCIDSLLKSTIHDIKWFVKRDDNRRGLITYEFDNNITRENALDVFRRWYKRDGWELNPYFIEPEFSSNASDLSSILNDSTPQSQS